MSVENAAYCQQPVDADRVLRVPGNRKCFGVTAASPGEYSGEPPAEPLEEIVVVANKQARSIRDVAANVTVFAREDFDANLAVSIADVLRYTPGIDEEWGGTRFGHEGINIRGIGGNRVAVLVDGVPLSDQFDVGSFSNATRDFLNTGLIHRMEILHGPASALYGSAAIGGVIAVQTPDPRTMAQPGAPGGELQTVWRGADDSRHGTALMAADDRPRHCAGWQLARWQSVRLRCGRGGS
ncbi:MAG: TonB-dependent receptor plug domain-containing protein [Woeseiaceae bacterium]|nr:TonB-dependent receptor plug domain-containing protein [Woeseiaceae bacterium]